MAAGVRAWPPPSGSQGTLSCRNVEPTHVHAELGQRLCTAAVPDRKARPADVIAGVLTAIGAVPDTMASAVMATLNPVQGRYAGMIGTPVAVLATGSVFMLVNTTSAMAQATAVAPAYCPSRAAISTPARTCLSLPRRARRRAG